MRQVKFYVTLYSTSKEQLRKDLVAKGIIPTDIQNATKSKKQKLTDYLWNVTCPSDDYTTEQTASAVLKALKTNPEQIIDEVLINAKDEDSEIVMVQHMEQKFTVKEICNMAGI